MEKPTIFQLIENYSGSEDLIDHIKNNIYDLYFYYDSFNVFTYSSLFVNGSLKLLIDFCMENLPNCIDLESLDNRGNNALHTSCIEGYVSNVKYLLEAGFNPDKFNRHLETPMILAIESETPLVINILSLLVHYDADVNLLTPINTAIFMKNKEAIKYLLRRNVCVSDNLKKLILYIDPDFIIYMTKRKKKNEDEYEYTKNFYKYSTMFDYPTAKFFHGKILLYKLNS